MNRRPTEQEVLAALASLRERIDYLEWLLLPKGAPEEQTGPSTAVSGDITATPPTFTSTTSQENE